MKTRRTATGRSAGLDGFGRPLDRAAEYFVQDTRSVVGNCALWWAKDRNGYVCDLRDAGVYTGAEAAAMRDTDVAWPVKFVRDQVVQHVRSDRLPAVDLGGG